MTADHQKSKDLRRRSPGEKLWIARKAAGLTQLEAAALAGVSENPYGDAEKDRNPAVRLPVRGIPGVGRPSLALLLLLARRRSGIGLEGVAGELGVSRPTVLVKERRGDPSLRRFWEDRGFRFP